MTLNLCSYRHSTFFSGNTGTTGTAQQSRGFQRSLIRHESGNKGTQLCLIESLPPYLVPAQKTPGTSSRSERPVLEPLYPRSRVPTDFEFSRVNKGGYVLFLLPELRSFVLPSFSHRLKSRSSSNRSEHHSGRLTPATRRSCRHQLGRLRKTTSVYSSGCARKHRL